MSRVSKVKPHLSTEELEAKLKQVKGYWRVQRVLAILSLQQQPQTSQQVAATLHLKAITVRKLVAAYNKQGAAIFDVKGQGGRKNQILTFEQERAFLAGFREKARQGHIATISEIKQAFLKQTQRKQVANSTLYRLLKRHGWNKKKARPVHPKSNKEQQTAFKKTSVGR
jgi:transposase